MELGVSEKRGRTGQRAGMRVSGFGRSERWFGHFFGESARVYVRANRAVVEGVRKVMVKIRRGEEKRTKDDAVRWIEKMKGERVVDDDFAETGECEWTG